MYSVVVNFYTRGIKMNAPWSRTFKSTTMSGAMRKASTHLREMFHVITKKWRLNNYVYLHCVDIADLPAGVLDAMMDADDKSAARSTVDARPFLIDEN